MEKVFAIVFAVALVMTLSITAFAEDNSNGGAIFYSGNGVTDGNTTFTNNESPSGGAIFYNGNGVIDGNTTFTNNETPSSGAVSF